MNNISEWILCIVNCVPLIAILVIAVWWTIGYHTARGRYGVNVLKMYSPSDDHERLNIAIYYSRAKRIFDRYNNGRDWGYPLPRALYDKYEEAQQQRAGKDYSNPNDDFTPLCCLMIFLMSCWPPWTKKK